MRLVDDTLVVLSDKSFAAVRIKDTGEFELLGKKEGGLRPVGANAADRTKIFKVPLIEAQGVSVEDRVKLSIDVGLLYYMSYNYKRNRQFSRQSLVDVHDGRISFVLVDELEITRYDVIEWDDEFVYCRFRDLRPFTFLEQMFGQINEHDEYFVKDGKLYASERQKLVVFDVRSKRIRKLGHFERLSEDFDIKNFEVLDDGNILMYARTERRPAQKGNNWIVKNYLYLLKNPE